MRFLLLFFIAVFLFSCNTPEHVAKEFLESVSNKDFEKANKLSTEQTQIILRDYMLSETVKLDLTGKKFEIIACAELDEGNELEMRCAYFITENREKIEDVKAIDLVKIDGKWKVDLKP